MTSLPSLQLLDVTAIDPLSGSPLHKQVHLLLQDAIETHFEDGQSFWTEKLLIERLGVSRITVRHALAELTREGVLIREALRGSTVRKVTVTALGVVFEQANSDFVAEMIQQLMSQCVEHSLSFDLYPLLPNASIEELVEKIRRPPTEERLLIQVSNASRRVELYNQLKVRGYHVVSLDDNEPENCIPCVVTDSRNAVRLAIDHLEALGHQRIAFVVNEPVNRLSVALKMDECRYQFEKRGLSQARIIQCDSRIVGSFEKVYELMPALWGADWRPTALFTASDPGAWAALRWFAEHAVAVPEEVSVIGYEGVKPDAFTHPPLTTVAHPLQELARRAVEKLWHSRLQTSEQIHIEPHLVLRQSTGKPKF